MTPENKLKLQNVLAELYEAGDTPEDILRVTMEDLTDTEKFEEVDIILANTPKNYRYYEMLEEVVEEVANKKDYNSKSLVDCFDDEYIIECIKNSIAMDTYIDNVISKSNSENNAILIPAPLLTMDKKSRLEDFIKILFPYYNEQSQIQLNF